MLERSSVGDVPMEVTEDTTGDARRQDAAVANYDMVSSSSDVSLCTPPHITHPSQDQPRSHPKIRSSSFASTKVSNAILGMTLYVSVAADNVSDSGKSLFEVDNGASQRSGC